MHKKASKGTGGSELTGWSTAKPTAPTDYRTLKRWKPVVKRRVRKPGIDGAREAFLGVLIARIRLGKPLAGRMAESVRREVVLAGGLLEWAKRQPVLVAEAAKAKVRLSV